VIADKNATFQGTLPGSNGSDCHDELASSPCAISVDGRTSFRASVLSRFATRTINEVRGINRVVYDYTSKPPGTIEWE
jgi:hypothetical protein